MSKAKLACILSIAGTDPSGGAGIQADIKAISATGGYAASVITALVAQNTQGVQSIEEVSSQFVRKQLDSVFQDLKFDSVKIGMLHDERIIQVVSEAILHYQPANIVLDPVMFAKDGSSLLELKTIELLKEKLLVHADLITPNLPEGEQLLGKPIKNHQDMADAASALGDTYQTNILLKGGHLQGQSAPDVLFHQKTNHCYWFETTRIQTKNTHGTGCSLSSAIASYLGQGCSLVDAVQQAKDYLKKSIQAGARYSIGQGNGPVDHFYFLRTLNHAPNF